MKALATNRAYVKMHGATTETVAITDRDVTILGDPEAILRYPYYGLVLEIRGASRVGIYDLEISGGMGPNGVGISIPAGGSPIVALVRAAVRNNVGGGVIAGAGTFIAQRSMFVGNAGGGISLNRTEFDLQNNVIARNGGLYTAFGGVAISEIAIGTRRFEFNTVTANDGIVGATTGVTCYAPAEPITLANNIVYGNKVLGGGSQVGGAGCIWTYSDVGPGGVSGVGNINVDPHFVDTIFDDYHLEPGSPAMERADPAATLEVDIDGEARPQGGVRDMGADERAP